LSGDFDSRKTERPDRFPSEVSKQDTFANEVTYQETLHKNLSGLKMEKYVTKNFDIHFTHRLDNRLRLRRQ
jgi:hypothetical protein